VPESLQGTVASGGSLRVRITAIGDQTLSPESCGSSPLRRPSGSSHATLADRAAAILFYVAVVSGAITFTYWWLSGDKEHALIRTATVLVIGLPARSRTGNSLVSNLNFARMPRTAPRQDRLALMNVPAIWISVIFDKTGTLTTRFSCSVRSRGCTRHYRRRC